ILLCLFSSSGTKRLVLERKLMEHRKSDAHLMKIKYMKLKKYLKEVDERRERALLRNQTLRKEFDQFEAQMKTSSSEMIQKMEAWYRREIKNVLSLQEGDLSAEGDKEEEYDKQMLWVGRQAGIGTKTAGPRRLYHPATVFMGHHPSAISAAGELQNRPQPTENRLAPNLALGSPWLEGLSLGSRSSDLESNASKDGAAVHWDVDTSDEGSELISSVSDSKPGSPKEEQPWRSIPAADPNGGSEEAGASPDSPLREERGRTRGRGQGNPSIEQPAPAGAREVMLSTPCVPAALREQGRDPPAAGDSPLQPSSPPEVQGKPSAPDGFCNGAGSLKEDDLEACEAVVLHQLRALPDQQQDMDMLQTCLSKHASFLKKHRVQLTEEVAEMFESLLVSSRKAQDGQALPVSRGVLPEESGDRSPIQSNESSCSSPSIPSNGGEIKQAQHAPWLAGARERGWALGDASSKAREDQETSSESSSSLKEGSPLFSRTQTRRGTVAATKSKAFWGESDDSSSELEAALRPRTHSAETDDFDDFYD
ncbi:KIZ protein, partial [Heliornis fulica]|nr:KIZ protein [Heliornis fulica]